MDIEQIQNDKLKFTFTMQPWTPIVFGSHEIDNVVVFGNVVVQRRICAIVWPWVFKVGGMTT